MIRQKLRGPQWSPYGHEAARRQLLQLRRLQVILVAVGIVVLYALFLQLTLKQENDTNSQKAKVEKEPNEPVRVSVNPGGRPAFMNPQIKAPPGQAAPAPFYEKESKILTTLKPILPLVAPLLGAFWLLSRAGSSARGKLAELNLGVYKGAMPYEMHTARAYKSVFTHRMVDAHVFGRTKEHFLWGTYLKPVPHEIRRLLGEPGPDEAKVVKLETGRARVTVRPAPRPSEPAWKAGIRDAWEFLTARTEMIRKRLKAAKP